MGSLTALDIIVLTLVCGSAILGFMRGLVQEVCGPGQGTGAALLAAPEIARVDGQWTFYVSTRLVRPRPTSLSVSNLSRIDGTALKNSAPSSTVISRTLAMDLSLYFTSSVSRL